MRLENCLVMISQSNLCKTSSLPCIHKELRRFTSPKSRCIFSAGCALFFCRTTSTDLPSRIISRMVGKSATTAAHPHPNASTMTRPKPSRFPLSAITKGNATTSDALYTSGRISLTTAPVNSGCSHRFKSITKGTGNVID